MIGQGSLNGGRFDIWNQTLNSSALSILPSNSNVGIGTISPSAQLHTTGTVRLAGAGTPADGKVLTSDALGNATWQNSGVTTTIINKSADFTLANTDKYNVIVVNSTTTVTVTVPATLPAGFYCQIIQSGIGQVNVIGASTVTVESALGFYSRTKGSSIGVMVTTPTTVFLSGDTSF
jgi:hypothetical protein